MALDVQAVALPADPAASAQMMRSGKRPDGSTIAVVPFESPSKINDIDVQVLHAYLQTLPPSDLQGRRSGNAGLSQPA